MYPSSQNRLRARMSPFEVNFPGIPFMMSSPDRNTDGKRSIATRTQITTTRVVKTYKDGKLVEEETFTEDTSDANQGSQMKDFDKCMSYNTASRSVNKLKTVTRGEADELVTTGCRQEYKSGNETYNTQVGSDVKTATNKFETDTEDTFFANSKLPKKLDQMRLDDGRSKNMGCINSRSEPISTVSSKKDVKAKAGRDKKELQDSALKAHNRYRSKHGTPPLKLATDLCEMAQKWAEYLASIKTLKHSNCELNGEILGENVAYKWTSTKEILTGEDATADWYSEIKEYNFNYPGTSSGTGHFTQVVWKNSKELGVGRAQSEDGSNFVVANYRPYGNLNGAYEENVNRPKK